MRHRARLGLRQVSFRERDLFARCAVLFEAVFGAPPSPPWPVWALFEDATRAVAALQCATLEIACDGAPQPMAALRNVAVAPDRRGLGLMRALFESVLPRCDAVAGPTLLYAAEPALYTRFGFVPVPQHRFEGVAPRPEGEADARALDPLRDAGLLARLLATRAPVSERCAVSDDAGLAAVALGGPRWAPSYVEALDALIVHDTEGEMLTLVDVIAPRVPSLARILGALGMRPTRVRSLFVPDRLGWEGVPVDDDTGLMARGTLPPAMRRPFMIPPTTEF